jgi:quinol monooxygenase YgiN
VLVLTRYVVPLDEAASFHDLGRTALEALAARPGCTGGHLGRAVDDPQRWTLTTTWRSVGDYRRALSAHEVKLHAVPLMYRAIDEPSAYEELITWTPDAGLTTAESDRSADDGSLGR